MPKSRDEVTIREVYALMEKMRDDIMDKIDESILPQISDLKSKQSNQEGRLMMIPLIITVSVNGFFFIMNFLLNKP